MRQPKLIALSLGLAVSVAFAGNVATVNGVAIPDSRMDIFVKQVTERGQKDSPELRAKIKEDLVRNEALYQEAQKKGYDKNAEVQAQLDMMRQQVLVSALVRDYVKANPVSDAELKKEYDKIKSNFSGKEYQARHILVKDEAQANAIIAQLKKGANFADLAKKNSLDKGSAEKGGELGWANPNNFVPEFSGAMTKLAKGQITQTPVKTQFGYHIIKLEGSRDAKGPTFDQVKPELQREMQGQKVQKYVEDLVSKAKVQ
ncbi:peptidylprolyl isomerase [Jeongeupia sp. HS-3]|uniref:peptidylprolyl isomerase n=1 Tax=Jeongeupia sp. HS-3 TaxID=1009682 RepID=UPI0018A3A212|nr:peptidylprolyl isomerase [Jeongeupia sp. HS-3]BCL75518.1 peptidylprolyl isomerase [Jeongeupia sp. HS-3]